MIGNELQQKRTTRPRTRSLRSRTLSDVTQDLDSFQTAFANTGPSYQYVRERLFKEDSYKITFDPEQGLNTYHRSAYIKNLVWLVTVNYQLLMNLLHIQSTNGLKQLSKYLDTTYAASDNNNKKYANLINKIIENIVDVRTKLSVEQTTTLFNAHYLAGVTRLDHIVSNTLPTSAESSYKALVPAYQAQQNTAASSSTAATSDTSNDNTYLYIYFHKQLLTPDSFLIAHRTDACYQTQLCSNYISNLIELKQANSDLYLNLLNVQSSKGLQTLIAYLKKQQSKNSIPIIKDAEIIFNFRTNNLNLKQIQKSIARNHNAGLTLCNSLIHRHSPSLPRRR